MPTPPAQDHIVGIGDSRMGAGGAIPNHGSTLIGYDWDNVHSSWNDTSAGNGSQGSWVPDLCQQWNSNRGRTLGFINGAGSGERILTHWDPSFTTFYWDQVKTYHTNSGSPTVLAVMGMLGPNDVSFGTTVAASLYTDAIARMRTRVTSDYGSGCGFYFDLYADVYADPAIFTGGAANTDWIARLNATRQGVLDAVAAGSCSLWGNLTGQVYFDHTHPDSLLLAAEIGRAGYLGFNGGVPAPRMVGVSLNAAHTLITVTVDRNLANSLSSSVAGFRVTDSGSSTTISSAVVATARTIAITLSAPIAGTCAISFAHAEDAIGVTIPVGATQTLADASTYQAPLVPFFAQTTPVQTNAAILITHE